MYDSPEVARENRDTSLLVQTGLSADMARYYSPTIGRFISEDPAASEENHPPTSLYSYAENDPINLIDPTGRSALPPLITPESAQCFINQVWDVIAEPLDAITSTMCGCKRSGKWQCFSKCYIYDINRKTYFHGDWYSGWGSTPGEACGNAEEAARNAVPPGFRTRHCDCPRQKCIKK